MKPPHGLTDDQWRDLQREAARQGKTADEFIAETLLDFLEQRRATRGGITVLPDPDDDGPDAPARAMRA